MREPVYLVDGYGLIYRSYFAFIRNPLVNADGRNTSAIFGFFRSLFQLQRLRNPAYLAVAMDSTVPTFRHKRYEAYKANREKAPDDLREQIPIIEEGLRAVGVTSLRVEGYEADDIIATIAEICRKESTPCFILSSDKDLTQLVGDSIKILHPEKGSQDFSEWGEEEVHQIYGILPTQVTDYLALVGDSSDNIPGVAGIGDKTAVSLLNQFGSFDAIYNRTKEIKSESQRKKLETAKEMALTCLELVTLDKNVPLKGGIDMLRQREADAQGALTLFHKESITSFDELFDAPVSTSVESKHTSPDTYPAILTQKELDRWVAKIKAAGIYAFDCETDNIDSVKAHPIGFSLAVAGGEACYVPIRCSTAECLDETTVKQKLASLLGDSSLKLIGQNIKYDYKVLKRWGIEMKGIFFDTMVAAWLLDSSQSTYSLDRLAWDLLNFKTISYSDLIPKGDSETLAEKDLSRVADYAGEDADITYQLYEVLSPSLKEQKLSDLFSSIEIPNVKILGEMELAGIHLDAEALRSYSLELEKSLIAIERDIYDVHGREFNIGSPKQLQEVLFTERKLKPIKKTKTGFSTDAQTLEILAAEDPVCANILRFRTYAKLKSTYVDTLPELINHETNRVHTHYLQTGTSTGRLSSRDPNLQNIPIREEVGRRIRAAFTAENSMLLLSADYAQIEIVVLAALSNDPLLVKGFSEGKDIHTQTASILFGVEESDVTSHMRRIGKTINFGVIYGMSGFRLARDLKIPKSDGDSFITRYFERYAGVDQFTRDAISQAEEKGYVKTIEGRKRRLPQIKSRNHTEKRQAERMAVNTIIQGSAADIMKIAMIRVFEALEGFRGKLILQVHDELIFEVPEKEIASVKKIVKTTMETAYPLSVPLSVNLDEGESWGVIH